MRILHLSKYPPEKGGMDAVLRLHQSNNESVFGILNRTRKPGLGFRTCIPLAFQQGPKSRLRELSSEHDLSLYYNCWGADFLSNYDKSERRLGYIHNHFPEFERYARYFGQFLDGFITVNPATTLLLRRILRDTHSSESIQNIPLPISLPKRLPDGPREKVIGLVGRINVEQKRHDRIPAFSNLLQQKLPDFRIEMMGEGPFKAELRQHTATAKNISFLPWSTEQDYWKTLRRWKYILFLSDYEGLPISLLESICLGCIPIYPDLHEGDLQELPLQLYRNGDLEEAIGLIQESERESLKLEPEIAEQIISKHSRNNYLESISRHSEDIPKRNKRINHQAPLLMNSRGYNARYRSLIMGASGSTPGKPDLPSADIK